LNAFLFDTEAVKTLDYVNFWRSCWALQDNLFRVFKNSMLRLW